MGIRYEHVDFKYYEDQVLVDGESRSFSNVFPGFSANARLGGNTLQLSYTAKTKRPTYRDLSNNVIYLNRFTLQTGNPTLAPERIHDVTMMGIRKNVQLQLSYKDRRDALINHLEQYGNSDMTIARPYNERTLKSISAMLVYSLNVRWWTSKWTVGVNKQWFDMETADGKTSLNSPVGTFGVNNMFSLPGNWLLTIDVSHQTKGDEENMTIDKTQTSVDVSLSKSFFKNRLFVEVKGTDINYGRTERFRFVSSNIAHTQYNRVMSRAFRFTLRYNFNVMKSRYQGKGAGANEKKRMN